VNSTTGFLTLISFGVHSCSYNM